MTRLAQGSWLLLAGMLAGSAPAWAQASAGPREWARFTQEFNAYMDSSRLAGGGAIWLVRGRVAGRHQYGVADLATKRPVDERTLFHYGSITKTLTAVAIMQLRDRGLLSLDDPVTRWVPELRLINDPYGSPDSITIRMFLSHSAGTQNPTWPWTRGESWEPFEPTTWGQLVAMLPYQRLRFKPGTRYSYSNPGFIYLARVIEAITNDPWAVYVQKNIFAPLGMTRSYFGRTPYHLAQDRSHGYEIARAPSGRDTLIDYGADFDPGITIPNGGWNAPLDDLTRYLAFLTGAPADSATRQRHEGVLARRSLEEMWRPVVPVDSAAPGGERMGLSFFLDTYEGARIVGHTGSQAGYRAYLYLSPATSAGIVFVFNTANEARFDAAGLRRLTDRAFDLLR